MKKKTILSRIGLAAVFAILAAVPVYAKEKPIPEGIFVEETALGGMTLDEAKKQVEKLVGELGERKVTIEIADQSADTTAGELGLAWSNPQAVEEAAAEAVHGNLIQQYMGRKDLEKNPVTVPLEVAVEEAKVAEFLQTQDIELTAEPVRPTLTHTDGRFEIVPGQDGEVIDTAATTAAIDQALAEVAGTEENILVTAEITVKEPDITETDLASIQDVLGTFSTDFSSSGAARSKNLANGASKINGHVLMPGETLSGYECMHPFTTDNGYYTAAAYENGQVVDSVGGGVCQIATTLYNAALLAELDIPQRQNHSMIVTYVKPSMDAAIAGTYKDIKITNNYSTPIYVEGLTSGRTLTFTIYGKETRPANRQIEYVSETLAVTDPGAPQQRVDASLAPGQTRRVQSAHKGLKSRLWKVVTVDGVETERTVLHTDTYNASKAIVLVGPAAGNAAPAPTQAEVSETAAQTEAVQTEAAVVEGMHGGPGVTTAQTEAAASEAVPENQAPTAETQAAEAQAPAPVPETQAPAPETAAPESAQEAPAEQPAA